MIREKHFEKCNRSMIVTHLQWKLGGADAVHETLKFNISEASREREKRPNFKLTLVNPIVIAPPRSATWRRVIRPRWIFSESLEAINYSPIFPEK